MSKMVAKRDMYLTGNHPMHSVYHIGKYQFYTGVSAI